MVCKSCGEKPKNTAKDFTKAVVEINNPDKLVLFRKVVVPVSMGTEEDFPASVGKYYNVLLQYEANGDMYLYSSDGIPTKLSSDVSELQRQLEQLGIKVDGEILARISGDNALSNAIADEKTAREDADTALGNRITTLDGSLATVAKTGSYNDLTNKPTIGNATLTVKRNNANVGTFTANATANKSINISVPTKTSDIANDGSDGSSTYVESDDLATVATSGSYNDLTNKPTIGNATLTIKRNNTNAGTFTANATTNKSINIAVPTKTSDLTNDGADGTSTFVEADDLPVVDTTYSASSNNAIANSTVTNSLNRDVMTNLTLDTNPSTTTVNLNNTKTNLASPSSTTTTAIALPVASSTQAGVMNSSTFDAVTNNTNNINALLNGAVAVTGLPASPSQSDITTAWQNETGLSTLINRASVYDVTNNKVWTYYTNDTTWHAASNTSQVTVNTFTNSSEGVIKGSTNTGQVFAENDGTGSVNGWDSLSGTVADHTSKLATIEQGAEVNVQSNWTQTNTTADDYIKNKPANLVQDANYVHTDNNFTTTLKNKLDGIESGAEVNVQADWSQSNTSADDYIKNKPTIPTVNNATLTIQKNGTNVQTFTANSSTNKTANITVPTAVSELTNDANYATTTQLSDGLATKQNTLTAGSNITIANDTISATDTTYTAGNAIDIDENNVISADVYPADFFTSTTETTTGTGTDITLTNTAFAKLASITPKGDTFQQTYTGKNLFNINGTQQANTRCTATINGNAITVTSTAASTGFYSIILPNSDDLFGKTVTISFGSVDSNHKGKVNIYEALQSQPNSVGGWVTAINAANVVSSGHQTFTFPDSHTGSYDSFAVVLYVGNQAGSTAVGDYTTYSEIQIEAGSTATDYEPYVGGTAAPNPDYPQDVQVVTGEQTVKVTGKNLFDINNRNAILGYFDGSQAVSTIMIGTAGRNRIIYIPCQPSTAYSFSFADLTDMNSPQVGTTTEIPDSGVTVNRLGDIPASTLKLEGATTPSDAKYIAVRFQTKNSSVDISTALENCLSKFQIEQSQTATDYEAYQSQEYELNLFENLYDKDSAFKSGSDIRLDISVQPNTTYIFNTGKAWTGAFLYDSNDTQTRTVGNDASLTHSVEFTTAANEVKARLTFYGGPSFDIETYDFSHIFFYVKNLIELCKIGDYQDYIYKSNGDWYKHEVIKKTTLPTSGYTRWSTQPTACMYYKNGALSDALLQTGAITAVIENLPVMPQVANMTEYYNTYAQVNKYGFVLKTDTPGIMIQNTDQTAVADFHTWIAANPIEVRYVLATPVDTQITNEALIEQLGALSNTNSYRDTTHIDTASDGYNLPVILTAEAFTNSLAGISKVIDEKQGKLTAGENITIDANNVISATATGNSTITMTDTDPGEGQPLAADNYIAVYGDSGRGGFSRYTASQSIPATTVTTLLPGTTQTPDEGVSYANGVITIQKAGWWMLSATAGGAQSAAGYLTVEIAVNDVVVSSASGATTANYTHCRNVIWAGKLSIGDTVKVQVTVQSAMNITKRDRGVFSGVLVSED